MRDEPLLPAPRLSGRRPILSVQILRATAALCIVIHHAGFDADTIARRFGATALGLDRIFDWGFGVHLFFVISGFIMVRTARGFGEAGGPIRFLGRRLLRIVPLYWLMTTLVLVGAAAAPGLLNVPVGGWALLFGSYLFVPVARVNGEIQPILGQGWTLNYEMFFYVAFAAAMLLPRRRGLALLAATLVGLVVAGKLAPPGWPPFIVWTDSLLLEFLFGVGIGLVVEAGVRLGRPAAWLLGLGGIGAAVVLGPFGGRPGGLDLWASEGIPAAMTLAACVLAPPWPASPLILALAALGDASYSLYLTHPFTIRILREGWTATIGGRLPVGLFLGLASVAAVAIALAVFRWVERPMTMALQRRFPNIRQRPRPRPAGNIAETAG